MASRRKHLVGSIIGILAVLFLVLALLFDKFFVVKKIDVTGNSYYTKDEVLDLVFPSSIKKNTVIVWLDYKLKGKRELPFIEDYNIKIINPSRLKVTVYEKNFIGYVRYMNSNLYFDRDGVVVESSDHVWEGIPEIVGIQMTKIAVHEKIETRQKELFPLILKLVQLLDKYGTKTSTIYYSDANEIYFKCKDIKVELGNGENLEEKIEAFQDMWPEIEDKKATLNLKKKNTNGSYYLSKNSF